MRGIRSSCGSGVVTEIERRLADVAPDPALGRVVAFDRGLEATARRLGG